MLAVACILCLLLLNSGDAGPVMRSVERRRDQSPADKTDQICNEESECAEEREGKGKEGKDGKNKKLPDVPPPPSR